jgi:hypothetical protein
MNGRKRDSLHRFEIARLNALYRINNDPDISKSRTRKKRIIDDYTEIARNDCASDIDIENATRGVKQFE